jgi:hypothetical protein
MSVRKKFRDTTIEIGLFQIVVLVVCLGGIVPFGIRCATGSGGYGRYLQKTEGEYVVGVKTSLEKVFREKNRLPGPVTFNAAISAAQNEYESFQLILVPKKEDLRNVRIETTALRCSEKGADIDRKNIFCYRVGYVKTRNPPYDTEFVGWWPDPLFPLTTFNINQEDVQPIWVTVYVPEGTPSGRYEGFLFVLPENAETTAVRIHLEVWDFALPASTKLQVVFSLLEECIQGYYQLEEVPSELLREYYSFLLEHRINPTNLYLHVKPSPFTPQPRFEDMQFCVDRGLNALNVGYLYEKRNCAHRKSFSEEFQQNLKATLPHTVSFLRDHQWQDMAFVYGLDEPSKRSFQALKHIFSLVADVAPGMRRVVTTSPTKTLYGYVDVWVPRLDRYNEKICRQRQKMGEEIWWYVSAGTRPSYPNFFIDYPALDHRILFWMTWRYDISGFLYYALNNWVSNYPKDHHRWPEVEWNARTYHRYNGDGQLIYPGPDGKPYGSIRLEVIRDGIEDYEYLNMLQYQSDELGRHNQLSNNKLLQQTNNLIASIKEEVIPSIKKYPKDPATIYRYREMIANEISRLNDVLANALDSE